MRAARACRYISSSGRSAEYPSDPWTWIARSITSCRTFAPKNLINEISLRAADAPCVSITHAACRVIRRAACISAAESAIQFCTVWWLASFLPNASRCSARSHSMSKARRAWPSQRMQ